MRVTRFELRKVPPSWVWLIIHTDTDLVGLGEPYLEGAPEAVIAEVRRLEPLVVGRDPLRREALWADLYRGNLGYRGGPVTMSAISGIDLALWDLAGKAAGVSVADLLGGRVNDRIRMYRAAGPSRPAFPTPGLPYRSVAAPSDDSREAWLDGIAATAELGFTALKVHVKLPGSLTATTAAVDRVIERFGWAREAVGSAVDLALDIHDPHPRLALQLLDGVAPYRPLFVEEPVPQEQVGRLADLARQTTVPLAAGERWMGKWAFFQAMQDGALAVAQPDLAHAGGFTELKKIAAIAEATETAVAPHGPLSPIALAATLQLDASLPNFLVQEHNEVNGTLSPAGRYRIGAGYLRDPLELADDGTVALPDGPGLGIELDEAGLATIGAHPWSTDRG